MSTITKKSRLHTLGGEVASRLTERLAEASRRGEDDRRARHDLARLSLIVSASPYLSLQAQSDLTTFISLL